MRARLIPFFLTLLGGAMAMAIMAPAASAHVADVSISCTAVTFNYSKFPANATNVISSEVVTIDGHTVVTKSFSFTGATGSDTISLRLGSDTYSITGTATWTQRGKTKTATLTESVSDCAPPCGHHNPPPPPPPCPHHDPQPPCPHRH